MAKKTAQELFSDWRENTSWEDKWKALTADTQHDLIQQFLEENVAEEMGDKISDNSQDISVLRRELRLFADEITNEFQKFQKESVEENDDADWYEIDFEAQANGTAAADDEEGAGE